MKAVPAETAWAVSLILLSVAGLLAQMITEIRSLLVPLVNQPGNFLILFHFTFTSSLVILVFFFFLSFLAL